MQVEDGLHKGVIIGLEAVQRGEKKFEYIDITIEFEEGKRIKAGYPDSVSPESNFGKLLQRFGVDLAAVGTEIDVQKPLLSMVCQFMTISEDKNGNTYSKVLPESLKPGK